MISLRELSPQEVQALKRLREPGGEGLKRLLSREIEGALRMMTRADDMVSIHRMQGRVTAFEDLLRAAEESVSVK